MTQTRLGIPVDFSNEGIRGLAHYKTTNFPVQLGLGATWDTELIHRVGQVTGREARALGYTNVYSPVVDLARDPRWGRVMDCYGEDPYLVGELATAMAIGIQSQNVASTAKHWAVYSVPKGGRDGHARTGEYYPLPVPDIVIYSPCVGPSIVCPKGREMATLVLVTRDTLPYLTVLQHTPSTLSSTHSLQHTLFNTP